MAKKHPRTAPITITRTIYHLHSQEETLLTLEAFLNSERPAVSVPEAGDPVVWLRFTGINDAQILEQILAPYDIHELVIEDILNPSQQTKAETYQGYLFLVGRSFGYIGNSLKYNQLFLIVLPGLVLSFEPRKHSAFPLIAGNFDAAERENDDLSAGYLTYALLDCLIDRYFAAIDSLLDRIEKHDRKLFSGNSSLTLDKVHKFKQDCIRIRSTVRRMNDTLQQLMRWNNPLIDSHSKTYLRDLVDTTAQMLDRMDYAREMIQSLTDTYLNMQSNQLNLQMRLLTVITIIFMPLTLLTGIYGMNFDNMPELHSKYGYFILLLVMVFIVACLLFIFRRKRWL